MANGSGQVALLIDFENLVRGLGGSAGKERVADILEPGFLFNLAEEYGRVVVARAYADWRMGDVNAFQYELYNLGVDLIHVLAKRQKNAVDVKLAVDAIEMSWELPAVTTYVLVTGDRDFIHVLKALRRRGKIIVGVAPDASVSDDFATLCDRFIKYTALCSAYAADSAAPVEPSGEAPDLKRVAAVLRQALVRSPEGLKGAQVVPILRREISPTFDVSNYGFSKLSQLLAALPEVARVIPGKNGGDILLFQAKSPKGRAAKVQTPERPDPVDELIRRSGLSTYRYERSAASRRRILAELHRGMCRRELFSLNHVAQRIAEETHDSKLSSSLLTKYQTVLWQSRSFTPEPDQGAFPLRERMLRLRPDLLNLETFVANYECSILFKARQAEPGLDRPLAATLLGLSMDDPSDLEYCDRLLTEAEAGNGCAASNAPQAEPQLA